MLRTSQRHQLRTIVQNLPVDIKGIYRADTSFREFSRELRHLARGGAEDTHIGVQQLLNGGLKGAAWRQHLLDKRIIVVLDAREGHIRSGEHRLLHGFADIAVTDNCNLSHNGS